MSGLFISPTPRSAAFTHAACTEVSPSSGLTLAPPTWDNEEEEEDEECKSKSSSDTDNMNGDEGHRSNASKEKRYRRHNARQIQQLEMFFKNCPHPDDKTRATLAMALGLSGRQVKFWFQNRRTQLKAHQERQENSYLRAENERLRSENVMLREAMRNTFCPNCGVPSSTFTERLIMDQQLSLENKRLRDELDRLTPMLNGYLSNNGHLLSSPTLNMNSSNSSCSSSSLNTTLPITNTFFTQLQLNYKSIPELAMAAWEELIHLAQAQQLWIASSSSSSSITATTTTTTTDGSESCKEVLNYQEYVKEFPSPTLIPHPNHGQYRTEATRDSGVVFMNGLALVDALMDVEKWKEMFPGLISHAATIETLSEGLPGTRDGLLKLIHAEFQALSPLLKTREVYFLRFCKQAMDKVWVVVDVSLDCFLKDKPSPRLLRCRRFPSGCVVEDLPSGHAQVTWVEHSEVEDEDMNPLFISFVKSGMAFGANRWLSTLQRYCHDLATMLATNNPSHAMGSVETWMGQQYLLRYGQRIRESFYSNICNHSWHTLPPNNNNANVNMDVEVGIMKQEINGHHGVLICSTTSVWLPFSRHRIFHFLRDQQFRDQWDILTPGPMELMHQIKKGDHPGNNLSLLRLNGGDNNQFLLQESYSDTSTSSIVYAPVDVQTLSMVLQGEMCSWPIIPSGFIIVPDGSQLVQSLPIRKPGQAHLDQYHHSPQQEGSILTIVFEIALNHIQPGGKVDIESINTIQKVLLSTLQHIKDSLERLA